MKTKIILDTSVIFSGLISYNFSYNFLQRCLLNQEIEVFISKETFEELEIKLNSEKFWKYCKLKKVEILEFLEIYKELAIFIKIDPDFVLDFFRDPNDACFLKLAKVVGADYLITLDPDLLDLKSFEMTKVVKPNQFLSLGLI